MSVSERPPEYQASARPSPLTPLPLGRGGPKCLGFSRHGEYRVTIFCSRQVEPSDTLSSENPLRWGGWREATVVARRRGELVSAPQNPPEVPPCPMGDAIFIPHFSRSSFDNHDSAKVNSLPLPFETCHLPSVPSVPPTTWHSVHLFAAAPHDFQIPQCTPPPSHGSRQRAWRW